MFNFFLDGEENMLKKAVLLTMSCMLPLSMAHAQSDADFYKKLLISDEIKNNDNQELQPQEPNAEKQNAQNSAQNILHSATTNQSNSLTNKTAPQVNAAPFGLLWKANMATIKNMGIVLTPAEQEDYVNSFIATELRVKTKGFRAIQITFGEEDELWRIIAYGNLINDTPSAAKGLKQYEMYARLLNQKYGNQKDFYTPATKTVEKEVIINGRKIMQTEQVPEKMGNPDFLSQLQQGTATLYSTFEGNGIGAALALNVDGNGKSYIIIDYKNLNILKERENETLNIL